MTRGPGWAKAKRTSGHRPLRRSCRPPCFERTHDPPNAMGQRPRTTGPEGPPILSQWREGRFGGYGDTIL